MGRRRLEVGEHGQIKVTQLAPKKYRARCEVRCRDGKIRSVQADGPSKGAATDAVKARAAERAVAAGRPRPGAAAATITPTTPLSVLADKWMQQKENEGKLSPQTIPDYRGYRDTIKKSLGELRIGDVTPGTLEWFIETEAGDRPAKAANLRRTLRAMFTIAIRHDAYEGENPARELTVGPSKREDAQEITTDQLKAYRQRVLLWMTESTPEDIEARERRGGRKRSGPPRTQDLLDIVDMQLATGARIGEVLALRWQDVDLEAEKPTATIGGTIVRIPGGKKAGGGLTRQEHRKAKDRFSVTLPRFAVDMLLRRKVHAVPNDYDVIFPSSTGTLRAPKNLATQLRAARGTEWEWVTPHTFRRTVATLVEREMSLEDAAAQLGHAGTEVTARHYVAKPKERPTADSSEVLEVLAPADRSQEYPRN
ncbi:tyrosine-type recombinase/integrase [Gordonia sp. LUNF6]|uniref:tyrosine-type recombinase/integrase n=1 Tax=Gordonia sp. LUNF6 TaxID=3388658 RepID=UPI00399C32E6